MDRIKLSGSRQRQAIGGWKAEGLRFAITANGELLTFPPRNSGVLWLPVITCRLRVVPDGRFFSILPGSSGGFVTVSHEEMPVWQSLRPGMLIGAVTDLKTVANQRCIHYPACSLSSSIRFAFAPMTLDDLIALCDEMSALARAGVPFERGLKQLARELPGKLGRISGQMATRLERGGDLVSYLHEHEGQFPPAFAAIVESGLRVGRLPTALEDLAQTARRLAVFRRSLLSAWVYPLIVMTVAFGLGLFMLTGPVPVMLETYRDVATTQNGLMNFVALLTQSLAWWWVLPLLAVLVLAWGWWRVQQADLNAGGLKWWSAGLVGPVVRLRQLNQLAAFSHLLTLLVEHAVPLPEALRLAARGTANARLQRSVDALAADLERGTTPRAGLVGAPPVLSWLLCHPPPAGELGPALRLLADEYASEAGRQSDVLSWYGPIVLTAGVGGAVVGLYCLLIAGPWLSVLYAYIEQALS